MTTTVSDSNGSAKASGYLNDSGSYGRTPATGAAPLAIFGDAQGILNAAGPDYSSIDRYQLTATMDGGSYDSGVITTDPTLNPSGVTTTLPNLGDTITVDGSYPVVVEFTAWNNLVGPGTKIVDLTATENIIVASLIVTPTDSTELPTTAVLSGNFVLPTGS